LNITASLRAIYKVASSSVHVRLNYRLLLAKIVYLLLLPQRLPRCAMQQVNLRSFIAAKEISESALQLLSVYQVYAIQFRWVLH
jgi:hypothetical protein